jgi:hypothetical protein
VRRPRIFPGAIVAALAASACGSVQVTQQRIEASFAPTFANLVHVQEPMLGQPPVDAATLKASASCRKVGPVPGNRGAGTWKCTVTWFTVNGTPLRDAYDLSVGMDGCYTATVDGAQLGGPTLRASGGTDVINLLYVFDACFDTT